MINYVCVFLTLTDRASTIPSNIYCCQSGTWSDRQKKNRGTSTSSHESMKKQKKQKQNKNNTKKGTATQSTYHKNIQEGHLIERVWYTASREAFDTPPDRNYLALSPKCITSTTLYFQRFRFLYRHSRRRLGSPKVGPINAVLKHLKLATVTSGATSTLSASSACLFLCRCRDDFSSADVQTTFPLPSPTRP